MKIVIAGFLILLSMGMCYYVDNTSVELVVKRVIHAVASVFAVSGIVLAFIGVIESLKGRSKQ